MQLDRTGIVIRQRSILELLDLSMIVLKQHWRPIMLSSLLVGLPLLLVNSVLVQWMLGDQARWANDSIEDPTTLLRWRRAAHLTMLYAVQFPLASLPTIITLGGLIFYEPTSIRRVISKLRPVSWRCIWVLGIVRMGILMLAVELCIEHSAPFGGWAETTLLFLIPLWAFSVRTFRPFAGEILALELCPLRSKNTSELTYSRRSKRIHGYMTGDHISRMFAGGAILILLLAMLLATQIWLAGVFTANWQWGWWCDYWGLPISLWLLGTFFSVFRFLAYLDCRIRLEGWELELRMRAEAARLEQKQVISTGANLGQSLEQSTQS